MTEVSNHYAPPSASIDLPPPSAAPFFATSPYRLGLLAVTTFGLYEAYWAYKSWQYLRDQHGYDVSPFWRAVFCVWFNYRLFQALNQRASDCGLPTAISPMVLAVLYAAVTALNRLPDPGFFLSSFAVLFLLPANAVATRLNIELAPDAPACHGWSAMSILIVLAGASLLFLYLLGYMFPDGLPIGLAA